MLPMLTSGSISQILNGEDVSGAIMQILGCKKIPVCAGSDRYRLLISDGVTGSSCAMLSTQLNHLVTNKELEKFTIFSVDKFVCKQVQADHRAIILLNLTVLTPGAHVGGKLGNPVISSPAPVTNRIECSNLAKKRTALEMIDSEQLKHPAVIPPLTSGSINRILNGENVCGAVLQLLGCTKIPTSTGSDRYRLLISDGVTSCPFAMLGTQLNHLVTNKELEKFAIFSADRFICNQVQADCKSIILHNFKILTPGADVGEKLGNPVKSSQTPFTNRTVNPAKKRTASEMIGSEQSVQLTSGSINKILNGENVVGAVLQLLGFNKIPVSVGQHRYRLLISDGVTGCPFAMLDTQLNHLVTNKELEKFAIFSLDKFVCSQEQDQKVVILLNLTVLTPGSYVGEKLGNPVNLSPVSVSNRIDYSNLAKKRTASEMIGTGQPVYPTSLPTLTSGSINQVLNWKDISGAVIQILGLKLIPDSTVDRYRLLISDGVTSSSFGLLATQLNILIIRKELEKFAIIRVDKCVCEEVQPGCKVIILCSIVILIPGADVGDKLGNPQHLTPINGLGQPMDEIVSNFAALNIK